MRYLLLLLICNIAICHLMSSETEGQDDEEMTPNAPQPRAIAALSPYHNMACSGSKSSSLATEGVCLGRLECQREGGTNIGSCGILGICCAVERSCFNSSALKISYFVGPSDTMTTSCNFNVEVKNPAVCQVRLDFDNFNLAPPTRTAAEDEDGLLDWYSCNTDRFTITSPYSNHLGFKYLCGQNHGQHIYVPVNSTTGLNHLVLGLHVGSSLEHVSWRIKVTQLECSAPPPHTWSVPSSMLATLHKHLKGLRAGTATDLDVVAPPGCLQYYTDPTGTVESFNYEGTSGLYLPELNYAICFKRYPDTCQISYTFEDFQIAADVANNNYTNTDCDDGKTYVDYLYIPSVSNQDQGVKYCGKQPTSVILSKSPGPLQIYFHSGVWRLSIFKQYGFKISYSTQSC